MARLKRLPGTDRRYENILVMYRDAQIKVFRDIFLFIPKTIVSEDMGLKGDRFTEMIADPKELQIKHLYKMAAWFKMYPMDMMILVADQIEAEANKIPDL